MTLWFFATPIIYPVGFLPEWAPATDNAFIALRAYDVLTGKLAWTFHTIPRPGE